MLDQLNMSGLNMVEVAVKRLQMFEPAEGYYLAFSGGKDSVVIKALADMAGVKYDAYYNVTSVDPPELIQFIREHHPDVKWEFPRDKDGNRLTIMKIYGNLYTSMKSHIATYTIRAICGWAVSGVL